MSRLSFCLVLLILFFSACGGTPEDENESSVVTEILEKEKLEKLYLELLVAENYLSQNSRQLDMSATESLDSINKIIYDYYGTDSLTMIKSLDYYTEKDGDIDAMVDSMMSRAAELMSISKS